MMKPTLGLSTRLSFDSPGMKELYREIKINKHGLRFLPKLSLSGLAEVVIFIYYYNSYMSPGIVREAFI